MNKSVISSFLGSFLLLVSLSVAGQAETPGAQATEVKPGEAKTDVAKTVQAKTVGTRPAQALPDNVPALMRKANEAYAAKDYPAFRNAMFALHEKRPYNSDYMHQLVLAYALLDEKSKAYDVMLRMQQQGLSYDFSKDENAANIKGTQVFDYVNDLMKEAGEPMGESETVFVLPDDVLAPESIAWDEGRKKFLIGTVAEGSLLAVGLDGQVSELLKADDENGLWAIMDIMVDSERNRLWVSSASLPGFSKYDPSNKGRSGLFEFELDSLELIHKYPVPVDGQAHMLGSMVMSPAGDIFIVDRNLPLIYRKPVDEARIKPVLALKDMVSLRGAALSEDGRFMYVAGREMGIAVIDVATGRSGKLLLPPNLNLGGIDGLYIKDSRLFIIQNGIKPQRLMALQLDESGLQVAEVVPIAVSQTAFNYPNYGTIQSEYLYYFGNSHWSGGENSLKAVTVLRSPMNSTKELVQPDIRLFLEKQAQAEARKLEAQKLEAQKQAEEKN